MKRLLSKCVLMRLSKFDISNQAYTNTHLFEIQFKLIAIEKHTIDPHIISIVDNPTSHLGMADDPFIL